MFWIRYKDTENGAYTEFALHPGPTFTRYPDRRDYTLQQTQDSANVVQRPMRDARTRRWVWKNYSDSDLLAVYRSQWQVLKGLEYQTRRENNKWPIVEIWEDILPDAGFNRVDGSGNKIWTKVRFLQVHRTPPEDGGRVKYPESFIEFVIDDATFTGF